MKIEDISIKYKVKRLEEEDINEIYGICKENETYYKYYKETPTLENVKLSFTELPEGKTLRDKYFLGFYYNKELIAVADLIAGYPDVETLFIGWFIMNKKYQKRGIGSEILNEVLSFAKNEGFKRSKLGYIKGNKESEGFWIKNNFIKKEPEIEQEKYTVIIMEKELKC